MSKVSEREVTSVVRQILADDAMAVERLRARAAAESPAGQDELLKDVREKNLPLLDTTGQTPPSPGMVESKVGSS